MSRTYNPFSSLKKQDTWARKCIEILVISDDKIGLKGSYDSISEPLKSFIKKNGAFWNSEQRLWIINKVYNRELMNFARTEAIDIKPIPGFVDKCLEPISSILEFKKKDLSFKIHYPITDKLKDLSELPEKMSSSLYKFQREGIEFGLKLFGRVLIADEMGVGKTIQGLGLAYIYKADWPLLIVTTSSLRLNWRDEVLRWLPEISSSQIQILCKGNTEFKKSSIIFIISYDLCLKFKEKFEKIDFKTIIADEAHYLKTLSSKRTESLLPLLQKSKHPILLSGTPAFARPKELFSLVSALKPHAFTRFEDFGRRYCDPKPNKFSKGTDYDGATNVEELHFILSKTMMIRRLKKDVLHELPDKRRQKVKIEVNNKIAMEIRDCMKKIKNLDQLFNGLSEKWDKSDESLGLNERNDNKLIGADHLTLLSRCYKLTGQAKMEGILDFLEGVMENDLKCLIFGHHLEVLDAIEERISKDGIKSIRIDGSVDQNERHNRVKLFQNNAAVKCAILSISAAGVGLTLTAASTVVFAEMHWTPALMFQAEDRAHRITQKECVNCYYLYGENTLDDHIYDKLERKFEVVSNILEGSKSTLNIPKEEGLNPNTLLSRSQDQLKASEPSQQQADFFVKIPNQRSISSYMKPISKTPEKSKRNLPQQNVLRTETQNNVEDDDGELSDGILDQIDELLSEARESEKKLRLSNISVNEEEVKEDTDSKKEDSSIAKHDENEILPPIDRFKEAFLVLNSIDVDAASDLKTADTTKTVSNTAYEGGKLERSNNSLKLTKKNVENDEKGKEKENKIHTQLEEGFSQKMKARNTHSENKPRKFQTTEMSSNENRRILKLKDIKNENICKGFNDLMQKQESSSVVVIDSSSETSDEEIQIMRESRRNPMHEDGFEKSLGSDDRRVKETYKKKRKLNTNELLDLSDSALEKRLKYLPIDDSLD